MFAKGPTTLHAFLLMAGGQGLTVLGALGAFSVGFGGGDQTIWGVGFFLGLGAFVAGGLLMAFLFFRMTWRAVKRDPPIVAPAPTASADPPVPGGTFPTALQAFLIMYCGQALAFFGCIGAVSGDSSGSSALENIGAAVMKAGLGGIVAGCLLLAFLAMRMMWRGLNESPADLPIDPPAPPAAPSASPELAAPLASPDRSEPSASPDPPAPAANMSFLYWLFMSGWSVAPKNPPAPRAPPEGE